MADEIVVTALIPYQTYTPAPNDPFFYSYGGSDMEQYYLHTYSVIYAHNGGPPTISYAGSNPIVSGLTVPKFQDEALALSNKLNNSASPVTFFTSDGRSVPITEVFDIFHHMSFTFTENVAYQDANYGGFTTSDSPGHYISNMDVATAAYYGSNGTQGIDFIMLHEVMHNTQAATAFAVQQHADYWTSHGNSDVGYSSSPQFDAVEKYVNDLARQLEVQLHIDTWSTPPHGY